MGTYVGFIIGAVVTWCALIFSSPEAPEEAGTNGSPENKIKVACEGLSAKEAEGSLPSDKCLASR